MAVYYIISIIVTIISIIYSIVNDSYSSDGPYIIIGEFATVFIIFTIQFIVRQIIIRKYRKKYYESDTD